MLLDHRNELALSPAHHEAAGTVHDQNSRPLLLTHCRLSRSLRPRSGQTDIFFAAGRPAGLRDHKPAGIGLRVRSLLGDQSSPPPLLGKHPEVWLATRSLLTVLSSG
jgi:hypothetical protein